MAIFGDAVGEAKTAAGKKVQGSFIPLRVAAERLKVHPSTLKRWLKNKKVQGVRPYRNNRKHWLVAEDDIAKLREYKDAVEPAD